MQQQHTFALLQLTRIGDVLQTLQAASAFRTQYPNNRLILIARKKFALGLDFLLSQIFDKVYYLDASLILENDLSTTVKNLQNFVSEINQEEIDLLANLSFSKSSSFLATLIQAKHKMGLQRNNRGELKIDDKWSQFIYSNVMNGPHNPFNLVDIYRSMLGTSALPLIFTHETKPQKSFKKVVIHPFASATKKRWGMTKWLELIYQLLKTNPNLQIHIMGAGSNDIKEVEAILNSSILNQHKEQIISHVGKLSINESFNLFKDADLFIGHDSMGGHMAAINAVPSITLSLGTVRPHETTPYGHLNYNLSPRIKCFPCFADEKCELLPCHAQIHYQVVNTLASAILNQVAIDQNFIKSKISAFHLDGVYIHQSNLSEELGMELMDLTNHPFDLQTSFRNLYFFHWNFIFRDLEPKVTKPKLTASLIRELNSIQSGLEQLFELNNFGMKYSQYILTEAASDSPKVDLIKNYSKKLQEVDDLTNLLKKTYPILAPLIDFYFVAKANLKGNNIIELTESSYVNFHEFNNSIQLFHELLNMTLKEAKPKLVSNNTKVVDN